jgi:hypothetical protein
MLNILSLKYQKKIALVFLSVFFISGISSLRAQSFYTYAAPKGISFYGTITGSRQANILFGNAVTQNHFSQSLQESNKKNATENFQLLSPAPGNSTDVLTNNNSAPKTQVKKVDFSGKQWLGGPGQPEMSAFKPVGADNLADPFSGDFSYNIPLLDVGGYPVNMFYNSGITMDQEASWVGLGWNINPGTIMRNMRGVPDDFNGSDKITKRQSIRPDKTWGVSAGAGLKFAGFPMFGLNVNAGLSFNNKLGVALEAGIHPSLSISADAGGEKTAGLSFGANLSTSSRNGASLTPSINVSLTQNDAANGTSRTGSLGLSYTQTSRTGITGLHLDASLSKSKSIGERDASKFYKLTSISGTEAALSSSISFAYPTVVPSIKNIFTRRSYNLSFSVGGEIYGLNGHGRLAGFYTENRIDEADQVTTHAAYGMLNYQKANNDPNAMLDFNRANDGVYTPNSPAIAMPVYTYDVFSINGEGTGGSFRATRNDLGFMRDAYVKTRDDAGSLGLDLGFGNTIHGGAEFSFAHTPSDVGGWNVNNLAKEVFKFRENDTSYQSVYFKNPGEKAIPDENYQNEIGGENLVRLKLANIRSGTPMLLPRLVKYDAGKNFIGEKELLAAKMIKPGRDKRTQVISFLNAEEASKVGFDKQIYHYNTDNNKIIFGANCNKSGIDSIKRYFPNDETNFRKAHHISEIDVLGTDGRKYVYGIPVYNTKQVDVSFSIGNGDTTTGKSSYVHGTDDTTNNRQGRDWFMNQEEMPAYTHSFLLTALVSPNYVDVKLDGITEDDMGDAIKFNYSKFSEGYKWRTPAENNKATYSEGLKTDHKDDKAHYVYGEREMWHLYSIESKNMVARFYVKNDRMDSKQVLGPSGGLDNTWGMQRLEKISLFSKGDLMKLGDNARPIKTIKFFQSYKLCKNLDGTGTSIVGSGKLTLDSIWISYNGANKKAKSRYVFYYPSDKNPDYNYNANDKWGNYKPSDNVLNNNPGGLRNADYPYSIQDKTKADKYAASWVMNKVLLPSGGVINVDFESDDYGYVQDKKTANMFGIKGFGDKNNPSAAEQTNPYLFSPLGTTEYEYVYVQLSYPITSALVGEQQRELKSRYFENSNQLYMKLAVKMPPTPGLAGFETIPVYAEIEKFGIVPGTGGYVAYVQVRRVAGGSTPMVQQALQFIKQQLPGKAYPGYDVKDESTAKAVVLALAGMITSVAALKMGEDAILKTANKCREVQTDKSFVRLTNPLLTKYGGGLRVKRVTINDNWNKMTNQYEASYGQEYKYTTTELINGQLSTISSGVASWEPSMGSDENPHKEIMRYMNHNKGGPYDFGAIEMPLGEMFYPSPMIGYSRVEVLSIHRDTVKNLPTRQVTEFFTTKDFPFRSSSTQLSDPEANVKYEPSAIKQLLKLDMKKAITQSQGFLVDMNDMNGKVRIQATYAALDSINAVSYTENFYNVKKATDKTYKFNHVFPTIGKADGVVNNNTLIGRDIELMADFRQHKTETITTNISVNFDFFFLGIFPIPLTNLLQPVVYEGTTYRSASLLKIVNHYGMLDSVVVIDKGSMVSTKNLLYDAETGNPLLTRTNNEHNKPVYNFSYPAHWAYSGMGPAYKNIDAIYKGLTFRHGKLENVIDMSIFESGDELYIIGKNNRGPLKIQPCDGPIPGWLVKNDENKIWAVNTAKVGSATPQMVFMDKDGNPYTAANVSMRIVRSGHRNMLDQMVGSITSMQSPLNEATGLLEFKDATSIIQTSAATFKDHWRVDNSFYQKDSIMTVITQANILHETVYGINVNTLQRKQRGGSSDQYSSMPDKAFEIMKERYKSGTRINYYDVNSWVNFNLPSALNGATVVNATIDLNAHTYNHYPPLYSLTPHSPTAPHYNGQEEGTGFQSSNVFFKVSRMKTPWYSPGDNNWRNVFDDNNAYIDNPTVIVPASPYPPQGFAADFLASIKPLAQAMVDNMNNGQQASGIKLSYLSNSYGINAHKYKRGWEPYWRYCFNYTPNPKLGEGIKMDIDYYKCDQANTVVYSGNKAFAPAFSSPYFAYCYSDQLFSFCLSKFTQRKSSNPYVEGVLGNWRVDSTYSYFGDRKEMDPAIAADTRTAGTIINYKNFWNFNTTYLLRNYAAGNVWVWNSTITQYNRKGYEIENKDPLGRFNSGLYGYNQQLPVAVANNARVREIMFDGFEDYDYETALNCITCKPRRHANFDAITNSIDASQKHTGRYSLRVDGGKNIDLKAPVTNLAEADKGYGLRIKVDSTSYTDTIVNLRGTGFRGKYYNYVDNRNCGTAAGRATTVLTNAVNPAIKQNEQINFPPFILPQGINSNGFAVRWDGYIQPVTSGNYSFQLSADDGFRFTLTDRFGNTVFASAERWDCNWGSNRIVNTSQPLIKGELYKVTMDYFENRGYEFVQLNWKLPGSNSWERIPVSQVYSPENLSLSNGTVTTTLTWCTKLDSVQVRGNALTDTFSLIQGRKMVLSTWVKEGGSDCKCSTYVNNGIVLSFSGSGYWETLLPKGNIIEGWQRYEAVFTVPLDATGIQVTLKNYRATGGAPVFFDDIRIHPFNANVKSFVYHSSSLRLMSEHDENNYASFYEYDDDGTLTRVKKETINGVKTITETRSAMQKTIQ